MGNTYYEKEQQHEETEKKKGMGREHMDMRDRRLRHEIETIKLKKEIITEGVRRLQNSYSKAISCFFANLCKL